MREITRSILILATGSAVLSALAWRQPGPAPAPAASIGAPPPPRCCPIPKRGDPIPLPGLAGIIPIGDRLAPTFLHFYNPACPSAPDSLEHLATLIQNNRDGARFAAIVEPASLNLARRQLRTLGIPAIADHSARIASACGITSTPAAVILDADGRLHFRGPYSEAEGQLLDDPAAALSSQGPYQCLHPHGIAEAIAPIDDP
jgi:hypothetical protein